MEFCLSKKTSLENEVTLEEVSVGKKHTILSVPDHSLLESLGFRPGKKITVKARGYFKGPVVCCVDGRNVAICRKIARQIILN